MPTGDIDIEAAILALLERRGPGKSICPSEVARELAPEHWRTLMPSVRASAGRLATCGTITVTQRERVLSPDEPWKGAIRLRRARA